MLHVSRRELFVSVPQRRRWPGVPAVAFAQAASSAAAWDLSDLYPSDAAWETERQALLKLDPAAGGAEGDAGAKRRVDARGAGRAVGHQQADFAALHLRVAEGRRGPSRRPQPGAQTAGAGRVHRARRSDRVDEPEVVALGAKKVNAFIAADPVLKKRFAFGLRDTLRLAPHILSPKEEQILASAGTPLAGPQDIRDQLASSDIPRPTVKLSDGKEIRLDDQGYTIARAVQNRADRKMVFDKFWASYKAFENSLGAALASQIKGQLFNAKARHYDSALQASLDGGNTPEAVYRSLIAETNRACPCSTVISRFGSGCSGFPTWAIGTSTRRW